MAKIIAGARRGSGSHDVRMPITLPVLNSLLKALPSVCMKGYERHLLQCMFALAFHAFLRIGEIVAKSVKEVQNILQLSDVHLPEYNDSEHCMITLRKFKHSAAQGPQTFVLQRSTGSNRHFCPVHLLQRYLERRGAKKGPLFVLKNRKTFLRRQFDAKLKSVLQFKGYSTMASRFII